MARVALLLLALLLSAPALLGGRGALMVTLFLAEFLSDGRWRPLTAATPAPVVRGVPATAAGRPPPPPPAGARAGARAIGLGGSHPRRLRLGAGAAPLHAHGRLRVRLGARAGHARRGRHRSVRDRQRGADG